MVDPKPAATVALIKVRLSGLMVLFVLVLFESQDRSWIT